MVWGESAKEAVGDIDWALAGDQVKNAVSDHSLDPLLIEVSGDVRTMNIASPLVQRFVPKKPLLQVVQQMTIFGSNLGLYICTTEVGVLFTVVL